MHEYIQQDKSYTANPIHATIDMAPAVFTFKNGTAIGHSLTFIIVASCLVTTNVIDTLHIICANV